MMPALRALRRDIEAEVGQQPGKLREKVQRTKEDVQKKADAVMDEIIRLSQTKLLSGMAARIGREINPHLMTALEFARRKKSRDHFLTTVLASPKLFVIGTDHELETMG
jgi:hypothetical protein